jgi:hypothetical protein
MQWFKLKIVVYLPRGFLISCQGTLEERFPGECAVVAPDGKEGRPVAASGRDLTEQRML